MFNYIKLSGKITYTFFIHKTFIKKNTSIQLIMNILRLKNKESRCIYDEIQENKVSLNRHHIIIIR